MQLKEGVTQEDAAEALGAAEEHIRSLISPTFGARDCRPESPSLFRKKEFPFLMWMHETFVPVSGAEIAEKGYQKLLPRLIKLEFIRVSKRSRTSADREYELTPIGQKVVTVYDAIVKLVYGKRKNPFLDK